MSNPNANDLGKSLMVCGGALQGCGCLMMIFVTIPILILLFLALLG